MKVIIDPIVKQLFFDRIQETYGNHSAMFWIENVAYGNTPVILQDELVSLMETLENTIAVIVVIAVAVYLFLPTEHRPFPPKKGWKSESRFSAQLYRTLYNKIAL